MAKYAFRLGVNKRDTSAILGMASLVLRLPEVFFVQSGQLREIRRLAAARAPSNTD